ncbi:aminoacyl tRNA synthase complex-interacting multifunctional protein 2-like [Argonauta hians]
MDNMSTPESFVPSEASTGEMYHVKPYHSFHNLKPKPTDDMYYVKPVNPIHSKVDTDPISELENQQAAIFARLKRIQNELDKMSHSTKCGESGQTAAPLLDNIKFQDLVIGVDPESLPFSVLILYQELSRSLKVKPTVYVHSSIEKKPSSQLCNIFDLAAPLKKPEDRRLSNDLLLSIIYKQVQQGCSLMVNPEKQTYIYGEVNVARYFSRLMNPSYDKDPVQSTQIDAWVDKASLLLYNGNAEQNKEMLKDLDSTLAKRKWLVGQDLSLADIVSWSGIQRNKLTTLVSSNVEVWMKTCASHPMFNFVNKVLSHL